MRVALAVCPCHYHNLGVGYINAVLRKAGHKVTPYDLDFLFADYDRGLLDKFILMTQVYQDKSIPLVQFFLRPEIIFSSVFGTISDMRRNAVPEEEIKVIGSVKRSIPLFSEMILRGRPEAVLFSTTVTNMLFTLLLAQDLKKKAGAIPVIFGGVGVSVKEVMDVVLQAGIADYCVAGEGEDAVRDLLGKLEAGKPASGIPGVACLVKKRLSYRPRSAMVDLDSLPYPDLDDFPFSGAQIGRYAQFGAFSLKQFIPVAASRWCANKCVFCFESVEQRHYRLRKVESVIREIVSQAEKYKSDSFWLCDSTFNIDRAWLEMFCDSIIKKNIKVHFKFVHLRPKCLPFKLLDKMRRAGFESISYGVESFSEKVLNNMCKRHDVSEMRGILINTARLKIKSRFGLIYNFPGQKQKDVVKNMDELLYIEEQLYKRGINAEYFPENMPVSLRIDPHSAIFRNAAECGIALSPYKLRLPRRAMRLEPVINKTLLKWKPGLNADFVIRDIKNMYNVLRAKKAAVYTKNGGKRRVRGCSFNG